MSSVRLCELQFTSGRVLTHMVHVRPPSIGDTHIDTTCYITGPYGGVWHPDAWAALPCLLRTVSAGAEYTERLNNWLVHLHTDVIQPHATAIRMDMLHVGVAIGTHEPWQLTHEPIRHRAVTQRVFWTDVLGEYDGTIFATQVVDGYGISTCRHCGYRYFREFIDKYSGTPMIYWIMQTPDGWDPPGPGHFQYDSICGGLCWTCGIDGPPEGPAKPD